MRQRWQTARNELRRHQSGCRSRGSAGVLTKVRGLEDALEVCCNGQAHDRPYQDRHCSRGQTVSNGHMLRCTLEDTHHTRTPGRCGTRGACGAGRREKQRETVWQRKSCCASAIGTVPSACSAPWYLKEPSRDAAGKVGWTESHNRGEAAIGARGEASRMKREMRL